MFNKTKDDIIKCDYDQYIYIYTYGFFLLLYSIHITHTHTNKILICARIFLRFFFQFVFFFFINQRVLGYYYIKSHARKKQENMSRELYKYTNKNSSTAHTKRRHEKKKLSVRACAFAMTVFGGLSLRICRMVRIICSREIPC